MIGDSMLIVAALNGMRSRAEAPAVPYLADELAAEAKRAVDAGAGIVHLHARKEDGSPAFDLVYDEIIGHIRALVGDVPVSITTQRPRQTSLGTVTALFDFLREPPDLAAVNVSPPAPGLAGAPRGGAADPGGAWSAPRSRPWPTCSGWTTSATSRSSTTTRC